MKIKDIRLNPDNPRFIKDNRFEKLKDNIKAFPKMMKLRPIVIDDNGIILGGNMRYRALIELGYDDFPDGWVVKASELTDDEKRRFIITDNIGYGEFDMDLLANEWDLEELQEWGVELGELDTQLEEAEEDDFDVDNAIEETKEPICKLGDIWQLGNHRIMCGDSTKREDVEKLMDGKKADCVFTDPPYGIDYQDLKKKFHKIVNDKETDIPKILKSIVQFGNIPYYIFCNWQSYPLFFTILKDLIDIKALIVWDKKRGVQNLDKYYKRHELIIYSGAFGGETTIEGDIWEVSREVSDLHPTMKPIELCSKGINYSSQKGNIVADLFLGSGSTLIACEQLNRICYGMEIDPIYCDVVIRRWEDYTGKKAVKL